MKKKKYMGIITAGLMTVTLAGCSLFPDGTTLNHQEDATIATAGTEETRITAQLTDVLSVDAEVSKPKDVSWNNYQVSYRSWTEADVNKAAQLIASMNETLGSPSVEEFEAGKYSIQYNNATMNIYSDYSVTLGYRNKLASERYYEAYVNDNIGIMSNAHELFPLEEISGLSREESIGKVRSICEQLKISVADTPDVYVIDSEHAQIQIEANERLGEDKYENKLPDWTSEMDAYLIYFTMTQDNINITRAGYSFEDTPVSGSEVVALIGREGLMSLHVTGLYDTKTQTALEGDIKDENAALSTIQAKFYYGSGSSTTNSIKVTDMKLEYLSLSTGDHKNFNMKPYWICDITEHKVSEKEGVKRESDKRSQILIDAVTGTVLE